MHFSAQAKAQIPWITAILVSLLWCAPASAQNSGDESPPILDDDSFRLDLNPTEPDPEPMLSLMQVLPRYSGDLSTRSHLTGDWGGLRNELAEDGITLSVEVTQVFQSNVSGGRDTNTSMRYSGSADYYLRFDTARLGLWPAGQLLLHAETQFGRSINSMVGSVMPANADALFPYADDAGETTLTQVWYTQFLSEKFGFVLGKGDFRGADQVAFAHDENSQFLNLAFLLNPVFFHIGAYSSLRAGVFYHATDWLSVTFSVIDPLGTPGTAGFDTAFHSPEGTMFYNEWIFTIEPFGLPGHQRFGFTYSTRDVVRLNTLPFNVETRSDDWNFIYNFDQYLYIEDDDPSQGVGIFGRFGYSTGEANPVSEFYSFGVSGKGIVPERDNDTFGVGYYYINLSDDIPAPLGLGAEQGIEAYYNIEITPWFHVSPDIQVLIDPGGSDDNDVAVVAGVRAHLKF